eukprot:TRINITY_DN9916_c0_g1_i4.p1 TRINITY_DN9916_c0_g1~~TRINITY_DN9916_c0_g1_i4.p1  ORF type:complete len:107 (-),score=38.64 TRINITY_DN9916_c0_g1_i4:169-489(-)
MINGAPKKASKLKAFADAASTGHCSVKHVLQDSGPAESFLGEENFPPVAVVENMPMCSSVGMGGNSSSSSPETMSFLEKLIGSSGSASTSGMIVFNFGSGSNVRFG